MSKLGNRAKAQALCLDLFKRMDPSGVHEEFYRDYLSNMSDEEFDKFIKRLKSGEQQLNITVPNYDNKVQITKDNNEKLAAELGLEFRQYIWITDPVTGIQARTERKHIVYDTNVCRQVQSLDHKISVAKDNGSVDELTGQVRGGSRSSRTSGPEFMILNSYGLTSAAAELIKFRGGDLISNRMMNDRLNKTGTVSMNGIPNAEQRTNRSVRTLSSLLLGMHFENNFAGKPLL